MDFLLLSSMHAYHYFTINYSNDIASLPFLKNIITLHGVDRTHSKSNFASMLRDNSRYHLRDQTVICYRSHPWILLNPVWASNHSLSTRNSIIHFYEAWAITVPIIILLALETRGKVRLTREITGKNGHSLVHLDGAKRSERNTGSLKFCSSPIH